MLQNNNQTVLKRISSRAMKHNRIRNIFTVLAIFLTTFMFTAVFSIGFSLGKNMNTMMIRRQGTKSSITLAHPTKEQRAQAEKCKHLHAAGLIIHTYQAESPDNPEAFIALDYYDNEEFQKNYLPAISDVKGSYPSSENEIMLSQGALEALNIESPSKGMEITLHIDKNKQTFFLSGWFTDYNFSSNGFQGFISEAYAKSHDFTMEKDGILSISAKTGSQATLKQELENSLTLTEGQTIESQYDVQNETGSTTTVIVISIGLIALIITFSGYLLIYNVMYISITKDIRFYGMLKTIGTSPKQIKSIVKQQAFYLCTIGIPLGVIAGTIVSFVAVPFALEMFAAGSNSVMPKNICFHPLIYVTTILFGIFTVALGCRKPSKLAGKVSPVEALKYNGQNSDKIKPKTSIDGGKLYKMAYRNVFREKKRALLVFASLFMGTMAFLSTNTFINSMKLENYVNYYLPDDFTIFTSTEDSTENVDAKQNPALVDAAVKLAEDISKIDGITNLSINRTADAEITFDENIFRPFIELAAPDEAAVQSLIENYKENAYSAPVIGVDSYMIEQYNRNARQKIDLHRFEKGEICYIGYVNSKEESDNLQGKTITLTDKASGKTVDLEIGACPSREDSNAVNSINIGYYWKLAGAPDCILVSQTVIDRLTDSPSIDNIIVNCEPKSEASVNAKIKQLTKTNPSVIRVNIKSQQMAEFTTSMASMNVLTAGISIILILIGIINFINVMLTGVFTRKTELAIMESVGMTKKQIQKMLMLEGLYYGIITIGLICTVGNAVCLWVAKLAKKIADYAVFHYPWVLILSISLVIILICFIVPAAVYHILSKESITQRLRDGE